MYLLKPAPSGLQSWSSRMPKAFQTKTSRTSRVNLPSWQRCDVGRWGGTEMQHRIASEQRFPINRLARPDRWWYTSWPTTSRASWASTTSPRRGPSTRRCWRTRGGRRRNELWRSSRGWTSSADRRRRWSESKTVNVIWADTVKQYCL